MQLSVLSRNAAIAVVLAFSVASCGRNDAASYIASAKSYIAKSDYEAAIIELKNALVQSPDNGEARVLMGTALLATGNAAGAETEARKAADLQYAPNETYPLLARAMLAEGETRRLIQEFGQRKLDDATATADLAASLAAAHLSLGERKEARARVEAALAAQPNAARAKVLLARLAALDNDLSKATTLVDEVLADKPADVDALLLKSELQLAQAKLDDAIKTLKRAVEIAPADPRPRAALIAALVRSNQLDQAATQLDAMKKAAPNSVETAYLDALVSSARGDRTHALEAIQQVLKVAPNHLPSVYLAGIINFQSGLYGAAEDSLRKVIARAPRERNARQVLATIYLRTGRPVQAQEVLEPALQDAPNDPKLLRAMAEALLAANDAAKATAYFEKASALDKGDVAAQVQLAQARLASGDSERALKDLEAIAKSEGSSNQADLALISALLQRNQYDKALAAVADLEKKQPNSPIPYSLEGTVHLAKEDSKAARASFEKALQLDPKFFSAAYNLARLDLAENNPEAARKRYAQMLANDPKNEAVLLAQAEMLSITGSPPKDVVAAIDRAITANPASPQARLALIRYYLDKGDPKAALPAAQAALAGLPENPEIIDAVGQSQALLGQTAEAVETYKHLARIRPQNALSFSKLGEVQRAAKDYDAAIESFRQALAIKPDFPEVWTGMAAAYVAAGRPESAIAEGRQFQNEKPDQAVGFAIEGETYMLRRQWPNAAAAYRGAIAQQPMPFLAIRLYTVLQKAGKGSEAAAMADKWFKDHPRDVAFRDFVAQAALGRKDYPAAIRHYQAALQLQPNNTAYLNNLAWLLNETGDPTEARKYAEQAHRLAPASPPILDTLGWILVEHGDVKRGVDLIRSASAAAPQQNDIRLHLAKALLKSGDKAAAKAELQTLAKLDQASAVRDEAQKLLKDL